METFKNGILKISVRNLVEFVLRSGDIDNRVVAGADKDAMQEGTRLHKKIQGKMGGNYHAEVPLRMEFPFDNYTIIVEGRADGVIDSVTQGDDDKSAMIAPSERSLRLMPTLTSDVKSSVSKCASESDIKESLMPSFAS